MKRWQWTREECPLVDIIVTPTGGAQKATFLLQILSCTIAPVI